MVRGLTTLIVAALLFGLGAARALPHARGDAASLPQASSKPLANAGRSEAAAKAGPAAAPAPAAGSGPHFVGQKLADDALLTQLASGEPLSFKPVGSTSTVFRMRQANAADAAFKAPTRNRPHGPASEVAAYRLARLLGLDNVPPVISRALRASTIHAGLDPRFAGKWPEILERMGVPEDGIVIGAAIYWIPELVDIGVDKAKGRKFAGEWLAASGTIPKERMALAASLSNLLAFDYLIGNFDRWSGDNAMGDKRGSLIYARDHDQAFPIGMGERLHRRVLSDLLLAERFSRRFYRALQTLTRAGYERELAQDPEGAAGRLLSKAQLADVFDRRQTLLSHIEALIAEHGQAQVLFFE